MDFTEKLKKTGHDVEESLRQLLPPPDSVLAPILAHAMHYGSLGQGKRLRPFLVLESTALANGSRQQALRVGVAIECVHCYSLIHDDLPAFDDDDLRRGRETVHVVYGEATAILAGNSLLSLAFEILADAKTHHKGDIRLALIDLLAKASGIKGLCGGQMLDMEAEEGNVNTMDTISTLQSLKTGALFRAALLAGAILGEAEQKLREALENYAHNIGLAFQLVDDLLDHEATTEQLGKRSGKDKSRGKATFIDILGAEKTRQYAQKLVEQACDILAPWGKNAHNLQQGARYIIERTY